MVKITTNSITRQNVRIAFLLLFFWHLSLAKEPLALNFYPSEQGIVLRFSLDDAIFLYRDRLELRLGGKDLAPLLSYPSPQFWGDEEGYFDSLDLTLPKPLLDVEFRPQAQLELSYQLCSKSGFCYAPQFLNFSLQKEDGLYTLRPAAQKISKSEESRILSLLENEGLPLIVLSFFFYGLLLSLTPCTLPMIPILSSIIIAKGTGAVGKKNALFLSLIYVFFMALAYALAGVGVSFLGLSVQGFLQKPIVLGLFALVLGLLALLCFRDLNFTFLAQFQAFIQDKTRKGRGILSVALMGFFSALIVGPCIAAPLAGALLYIASSKDALLGGLALFVMGWGMGVPLLFLGLGFGFLRPGPWMREVRVLFGFILLGLALWMLSRFVREDYILIAYGILGVFFAVFMGLFEEVCSVMQKFKKAFLILVLACSLTLFVRGIFGLDAKEGVIFKPSLNLAQIQKTIQSNDKVLLYFTASWCVYCGLLDAEFFSDERVGGVLADYEKIKIDLSENEALHAKIMQEFQVFAPPVLIFFQKGKLREKITGYIGADEFLEKAL